MKRASSGELVANLEVGTGGVSASLTRARDRIARAPHNPKRMLSHSSRQELAFATTLPPSSRPHERLWRHAQGATERGVVCGSGAGFATRVSRSDDVGLGRA
jgi:hypothetical protein